MTQFADTSPFLRACRGLTTDYTPIWLMRQAGRYMLEYRAIRARHSMLEVIGTPELAAEVTLQPIDAFGMDAAIIFSDILPPLIGMGFHLEFAKGEGPIIHNPILSPADVDALRTPPPEENMGATLDAIRLVVAELTPRGIPLIGFAGAPFTLASYAVEGGGSKTYSKTKALMYTAPQAWDQFMRKLVTVQAEYLRQQVAAGAAALQLFDSWAGLALSGADYVRYVQPYNTMLFAELASTGVPVINFSTGTAVYLPEVAACGGDIIGIDWRLPLDVAWQMVGIDKPAQGNLDPVALLTDWPELKTRVDDVLARAAKVRAAGGAPHIFNLGHGIFPNTPVDNVRRLVEYVHEATSVRP
ncbi:MAG: uroporphyrinogen decarboxylase [Ardenticatenaceae bacterium]|nr:uroporphyrinogen decarboxylase [Ardenticatenaceae bacterium]MCB9004204.1 uroporphyrinogen decarboxylase [Ardenticatenaceae bacterium]